MTNVQFPAISDYKDLDSINFYTDMVEDHQTMSPDEAMSLIYAKGRDNARTPVQWSAEENAGFSSATPWIGLNPNYRQINAAEATGRADSLWHYYQKLISLRRGELQDLLVYGSFLPLDAEDAQVYAYERHGEGGKLLVVANFTDQELERSYQALGQGQVELVLSNYADQEELTGRGLTLRPYEARIYKIS